MDASSPPDDLGGVDVPNSAINSALADFETEGNSSINPVTVDHAAAEAEDNSKLLSLGKDADFGKNDDSKDAEDEKIVESHKGIDDRFLESDSDYNRRLTKRYSDFHEIVYPRRRQGYRYSADVTVLHEPRHILANIYTTANDGYPLQSMSHQSIRTFLPSTYAGEIPTAEPIWELDTSSNFSEAKAGPANLERKYDNDDTNVKDVDSKEGKSDDSYAVADVPFIHVVDLTVPQVAPAKASTMREVSSKDDSDDDSDGKAHRQSNDDRKDSKDPDSKSSKSEDKFDDASKKY